MMMSLFKDFDMTYASRISEYVMPPATKTKTRCRTSSRAPPALGARCQLGFALRKEVAGCITGDAGDRKLLAGASDGASLT